MKLKKYYVKNINGKILKTIESDNLIGAIIELNKTNRIYYRINDNAYNVEKLGSIIIEDYIN